MTARYDAAVSTPSPSQDRDHSRAAPPSLLYLMKQVELAVRARLDELVRPAGLTALQYTALTVLERHPDLTSAHLARNSFVTPQSMADMVTSLRTRGLIDRHKDPDDARRLVLSLTEEGRTLLEGYRQAVDDLEQEMLSGLSASAARQLQVALKSCREALSNSPASG
jgi:DNA-binding MarR family transcriptional regulator